MPNAAGASFGILTRIGLRPSPHTALYGCKLGEVHIDSIAIEYDAIRWEMEFLKNWPAGSPAWQSYFDRIANGPEFHLQKHV